MVSFFASEAFVSYPQGCYSIMIAHPFKKHLGTDTVLRGNSAILYSLLKNPFIHSLVVLIKTLVPIPSLSPVVLIPTSSSLFRVHSVPVTKILVSSPSSSNLPGCVLLDGIILTMTVFPKNSGSEMQGRGGQLWSSFSL